MSNAYRVVTDPAEVDKKWPSSFELKAELEELYYKSKKGTPSIKGKLIKLIKKHPDNPILRNYLIIWNEVNERREEAIRINEELLTIFPDYIFARVTKAIELSREGKLAAARSLLGDGVLDISTLYPERKVFHLSEYRSYLSAAVNYLAASYHFEEAEEKINELSQVEVEEDVLIYLRRVIMSYRFEKQKKWMRECNARRILAKERTEPLVKQLDPAMSPEKEMFAYLYKQLLDIDLGLLQQHIEFDKEALIEELYHILKTAAEGFEYLYEEEENSNAPLHALLILAYVDNENGFAALLQLFREPARCAEFWLGDRSTDVVSAFLKNPSREKITAAKDFILESYSPTGNKILLIESFPGMAAADASLRPLLVETLQEIMVEFSARREDDNLFDTDVLAFAVGAACDLQAVELLEMIRDMCGKGWVSEDIEGPIEDIESRFKNPPEKPSVTFYDTLYDHLRALAETNKGLDQPEEGDDDAYDDDGEAYYSDYTEVEEENMAAVTATKKSKNIARNAPCPCGSGKKYKRCHGL